MTDKHIPASKLEALLKVSNEPIQDGFYDPKYLRSLRGDFAIKASTIRAIIDEAPEVEKQEPFGYVLSINGDLVFRKTITEIESLVYSSMAVYCGDHRPVPSSVIETQPPSPDLTKLVGELVEALEHSRACLEAANNSGLINDTLWAGNAETLFDYMDAAIAKAREAVKHE